MIRPSFSVFSSIVLLLSSAVPSSAFSSTTADPSSSPKTFQSFEVDTDKAFAASTFPIKPDQLIARAKELLGPEINLGIDDNGACLSDSFRFVAAVVGPLDKTAYLKALNNFKLQDSFDIAQNMFGFTVSPMQPNRVYFFSQQVSKLKAPFLGVKPEQKADALILPPQCHHMDFEADGKLKEFGFYTVDRMHGNTGGLGGAFAYFYGVGKPLPFPECQPFKPSFRFRMLTKFGNLAARFSKKKKE
jgi:hypothetical protein